jgi:hypothetical protein
MELLYDRLLGLLQTVDLNKNIDQDSLSPLAPASPARPTLAKLKIAAVGFFLAFVVGAGLLVLLEILDDRFTSVAEVGYHLPEQVIGQIPECRLVAAPFLPRTTIPSTAANTATAGKNMESRLPRRANPPGTKRIASRPERETGFAWSLIMKKPDDAQRKCAFQRVEATVLVFGRVAL